MKKIFILSLCAIALAVAADTFTNGLLSPKLPLGDSTFQQLKVLRQYLGQTNVPMGQFVTNYLSATLNDSANTQLATLKTVLQSELSTCTDETKLMQVYGILNGP